MSQSEGRTSLADYRSALTTRAARWPAVASVLARLPIAMIGISALLYVQRETGSFAAAGLVSAGSLVGVSVGAVIQGRLIDRFGPTRPLLAVSALLALSMAALVTAIESHAPTTVLVAFAAVTGLSEPMVGSASRALWTRLLPPGGARNAAFSYEAISMEVFFILGPGLAGLLVLAPWAGTGLVLGVALQFTGAVLFALSPAVRAWGPASARLAAGRAGEPGHADAGAGGAGLRRGDRVRRGGGPGVGDRSGCAFVRRAAALGVVAELGGVRRGVQPPPWPRRLGLRLPALLGGFGALVALLAWPSSLWGLALMMLLAGALITPQSTAHSSAIELVAPSGTAAEAFGWVLTAVTLGLAAGQSVSGYVVEHAGLGGVPGGERGRAGARGGRVAAAGDGPAAQRPAAASAAPARLTVFVGGRR